MKENKGITLIALVITIIVLLILAGVSITMVTGDNSIIRNAQAAAITSTLNSAKEEIGLKASEGVVNFYKKAYVSNQTTTISAEVDAMINNTAIAEDYFDGLTYTYTCTSPSDTATANILLHYKGSDGKNYEYEAEVNLGTGKITWTPSADLTGLTR